MPRRMTLNAASTTRLERECAWWRAILRDVLYALREQDDLSREDIAGAIERSLKEGPP
jgi:hypothetical protein